MEGWKKNTFDLAYKMLVEAGKEYNDICDTLEIPEMKLAKMKFNYEVRNANDI